MDATAPTLAGPPGSGEPADVPTVIADRYEVLGLVGRGGMGTVYRVRDLVLEELVALKMLRRELLGSTEAIARFVQEVKLARKVTHPNVARTFDIGEHAGERFLTMEWVDGSSLSAEIERRAPLPPREVVRIGGEICEGVGAAHTAGVIHRDLKPDNVLMGADGRVVVTDFGIARASQQGTETQGIVGTPAYMAPEQLEGRAPDARVDVYAVGEILYEMLTGRVAWPGHQPFAVPIAKSRDPTPDPRAHAAVPDRLAELVIRCMERDPDRRFGTVHDVLMALRDAGRDQVDPVAPAPNAPRFLATIALAVRPFRNGGSPEDDEVARGLTEELVDVLSTTDGLRVRVAPVRDDLDSRALGRELSVDVVLEGTLRREGDAARLSARLTSVVDGFQVWARRFVAPRAQLLAISDEMARTIAEALASRVAAPPRPEPVDPTALDHYLRGRNQLRRNWYSAEALVEAAAEFEAALARAPDDPTFLAASALALVRDIRGPDEHDRALARAERAIALAPHSADAWYALANVRANEGDLESAVAAAAEAHRRAPSFAEPVAFLGAICAECGPLDSARTFLQRARILDPMLNVAAPTLAWVEFHQHNLEPMRRLAEGRDPSTRHIFFAMSMRAALWTGDESFVPAGLPEDEARRFVLVQAFEQILKDRCLRPDTAATLDAMARRGRVRMRRFISQLRAEFAAVTESNEATLARVEAAVDGGVYDVFWLRLCPLFAPLRSDPRWSRLDATVEARAMALREAMRRERLV